VLEAVSDAGGLDLDGEAPDPGEEPGELHQALALPGDVAGEAEVRHRGVLLDTREDLLGELAAARDLEGFTQGRVGPAKVDQDVLAGLEIHQLPARTQEPASARVADDLPQEFALVGPVPGNAEDELTSHGQTSITDRRR
jgi:hypothetical protein